MVAWTLAPASRSRAHTARTCSLGRWERSSHTLSTSIDDHSGSITIGAAWRERVAAREGCEGPAECELSCNSNRHRTSLDVVFFPWRGERKCDRIPHGIHRSGEQTYLHVCVDTGISS